MPHQILVWTTHKLTMSPTTFECFPSLPNELQAQIFKFALEEENQSRYLVVWDRRIMPFKSLVSPLLSVNHLSRKYAKKYYTTRLDIFTMPSHNMFMALPDKWAVMTTLRDQMLAEGGTAVRRGNRLFIEAGNGESFVDLGQHWVQTSTDHLELTITTLIDHVQKTTAPQGTLYLNPAQSIILYGHNCSPDFFRGAREQMAPGTGQQVDSRTAPSPVWGYFSSELPDAFFYGLKQDVRKSRHFLVNGPKCCSQS